MISVVRAGGEMSPSCIRPARFHANKNPSAGTRGCHAVPPCFNRKEVPIALMARYRGRRSGYATAASSPDDSGTNSPVRRRLRLQLTAELSVRALPGTGFPHSRLLFAQSIAACLNPSRSAALQPDVKRAFFSITGLNPNGMLQQECKRGNTGIACDVDIAR